MNHTGSSLTEKAPPERRRLFDGRVNLFLVVLALLVGDAAAGLAGGLAGSLALTAATVLGALAQVPGIQSLDPFHDVSLHSS
jgi:hypothetical protein